MASLREKARQGLELLRQAGAQEASCRVAESLTEELNYETDHFTLLRSLENQSCTMQAIADGCYGTLNGNRTDPEGISQLAEDCLTLLHSASPDLDRHLAPRGETLQHCEGPLVPDQDKLLRRTRELVETIQQRWPQIILSQVIASYSHSRSVSLYTAGGDYEEEDGDYGLMLEYGSKEGSKASSFFYGGRSLNDLETPFIELEPFRTDLPLVARQWDSQPLSDAFRGTVVMTPQLSQEFISYLLENYTGNSALLTGTSPWKDKLGQEVVDPRLTLRVAPNDERFPGKLLATAEGYPAQDYTVIEKGVLRSFSLSDYFARKTGLPRAANDIFYDGYILDFADPRPLEELLAGIRRGLYVMRFSGGMPAGNGDFSGVAKNSFLIEDGKLTTPLSEVMISGNLGTLFRELLGVSSEHINDGSSDLPWLCMKDVSISGK